MAANPKTVQEYALKTPRRRHPFLAFIYDVLAGAIYGDFARNLHIPGVITEVTLGFIPGLGTLCAIRDLIANLHFRDRFGVIVNIFALIPFFGGFAKIFDAIHDLKRLHSAMQRSRQHHQ
jgi:hypothetical protein